MKNFIKIFQVFITKKFLQNYIGSQSGLLANREQYSKHIHRSKVNKLNSNIDDEMLTLNSFTADGGGFDCLCIESVWAVLVWFCMENTQITSSKSLVVA